MKPAANSGPTIRNAIALRRRDYPVKKDQRGERFLATWERMGYRRDDPIAESFTRQRASELRNRLANHYEHDGAKSFFLTYLAVWRHWREMVDPAMPEPPPYRLFRFEKNAPRTPTALSVEQLGALIQAIDSAKLLTVVDRADWKALILILYYTGARVDMVRSALRSQYDPKTGRLRLAVSKGGDIREWELPQDCRDAIAVSWQFSREGSRKRHLCREPGSPKKLKRFASYAGLESLVNGFHVFRRTSVTHIAAKLGVHAAAEHIGHANVQTTLRYYIDPRYVPVRTYAQELRSPLQTRQPLEFGSARPEDSIDNEEVLFDASEGVAPGSPDV